MVYLKDARSVADQIATAVTSAWEISQGGNITDVSSGDWRSIKNGETARLLAAFTTQPLRKSADLVSFRESEVRIIEVKGRGSSGPISVPERELDTLRCAGRNGWLYTVWNTTQPPAIRLLLVQDPALLPWSITKNATIDLALPHGVQDETEYSIDSEAIKEMGTQVDLPGEILDLAKKLKLDGYNGGQIKHAPV